MESEIVRCDACGCSEFFIVRYEEVQEVRKQKRPCKFKPRAASIQTVSYATTVASAGRLSEGCKPVLTRSRVVDESCEGIDVEDCCDWCADGADDSHWIEVADGSSRVVGDVRWYLECDDHGHRTTLYGADPFSA